MYLRELHGGYVGGSDACKIILPATIFANKNFLLRPEKAHPPRRSTDFLWASFMLERGERGGGGGGEKKDRRTGLMHDS